MLPRGYRLMRTLDDCVEICADYSQYGGDIPREIDLNEMRYEIDTVESSGLPGVLNVIRYKKVGSKKPVNNTTINIIKTSESVKIPEYGTPGSAGADIRYNGKDTEIPPGESKLLSTGIKMEIPDGYEVQIRPKSGIAYSSQVTVLNTPGTIDCDFRGEIGVILINHGKSDYTVKHGDKIAQMVIAKYYKLPMVEVKSIGDTVRGDGGFGHTGIRD